MIACICEGGAEKTIIEILLNADRLNFTRDDLLEGELINERSSKKFEKKYLSKSFSEEIDVYLILDSHSEKFKLSKQYRDKVNVYKFITSPEIEMLVIIKEGRYDDFNKKKSKTKPSTYCKEVLKFKNVKTRDFVKEYFSDVDELVKCIQTYKSKSKDFKKGEKYLADLIK